MLTVRCNFMTTQIDHNKLLKKIAKERLEPYGVFQSGQSRIFLLDKVWFVIEFQPSSFSKGTYLNVNVDFNFYPRDYFAYSYGNRETGFEEFENEEQFGKLVNELCDLSIERVQDLELKFIDFRTALKTIKKEKVDGAWDLYENGFLNILNGNFNKALKQLSKVSREKCRYDWEFERKKLTEDLIDWLKERPTNLDKINNLITETRRSKKLPTITLGNLTERKPIPNSTLPKAGQTWLKKLFGSE